MPTQEPRDSRPVFKFGGLIMTKFNLMYKSSVVISGGGVEVAQFFPFLLCIIGRLTSGVSQCTRQEKEITAGKHKSLHYLRFVTHLKLISSPVVK